MFLSNHNNLNIIAENVSVYWTNIYGTFVFTPWIHSFML